MDAAVLIGVAFGVWFAWRMVRDDGPAPTDEQRRLQLALADRIFAAHEVPGRLAERRAVVISERDSCPLG